MAREERRRWITTLAEPVRPGPTGQPSHAAGAELAVIHLVVLPEIGRVSMTVPRPSAMLLDLAEPHVMRAVRFRQQLPRQIKRGRWIQPWFELGFSNEPLVYDFLQEAMGSVLLLHTAHLVWRSDEGADQSRRSRKSRPHNRYRLTRPQNAGRARTICMLDLHCRSGEVGPRPSARSCRSVRLSL